MFEVNTDIPYGNACDVEVVARSGVWEVGFAPDPHGGPETLWFCLRVQRTDEDPGETTALRLVLKHTDNILGGHTPSVIRPVLRQSEEAWTRLDEGQVFEAPDGRRSVAWSVEMSGAYLDVATCYPYGRPELAALVAESDGYWRADTIGVSQGGRPLIRVSNDYGAPEGRRPGLYVVARQHAAEVSGSWVLDGFLREIQAMDASRGGATVPLVWAVPLTNIDGIEQGDYGKDNFPYDLNRAWGRPPMRHETLVFQNDVQRWVTRCRPLLGIDFHAPGACETSGIYTYVPDFEVDRAAYNAVMPWVSEVAAALGGDYAAESFARVARYPSRWETPSFRNYGWPSLGVPCITFENPYAMINGRALTQEAYRDAGARIARAIVKVMASGV
jgi:hypothetical protein